MARIQILELPTEHHGDDMVTPFLLVVDQLPTDEDGAVAIRRDLSEAAQLTGARAVLAFDDTIEIPANDPAPSAEDIEISDAEFTALAGAVHRALGIDMAQVGVKPDMAAWLLTACRQLEQSDAARARLRIERAEQAADLKRLQAGEEPVTDPVLIPTPGQWIWHWNRATPEERLDRAAQIMNAFDRSNGCFMGDHDKRIEYAEAAVGCVRNLPQQPEVMDAKYSDSAAYLHGYRVAIQDAKRALNQAPATHDADA